jgi:hypothetical protein
MAAGGEAEAADGLGEQSSRLGWHGAEAADLAPAHARVDARARAREARGLGAARGLDQGAHRRRGLASDRRQLGVGDGGDLEVEVDAVEERAGKAARPAARETTTEPSSWGWRRASRTRWENSGSSSRDDTRGYGE